MRKLFRFISLIFICLIFIYIYSRFIEPTSIKIHEEIIQNDNVSSELENIKILQFSDTHLSEYFNLTDLRKVVEMINSQNPDIVIFSGDLIDNFNQCTIHEDDISYELKQIQANIGKYAVYGNHDYGGGAHKVYDKIFEGAEFSILTNESVYLPNIGLNITGLDDAIFGEPDLSGISQQIVDGNVNLLICHEPDIIDHISDFRFDLTIAGHSHGEQINIPFLDDYILPSLAKNYIRGLYTIDNEIGSKIYVNKGIGTTKIPLRLFAQPEITVFKFESKK